MVEYDLFKDARIQIKSALFDIDELYKHVHDWLEWRKYEITEAAYKESHKSGGREIEIKWDNTRDIDEYSRFLIKIRWHLLGINDVEVEHAGKNVKMQKGELNVYISCIIVYDYKEKWEQSPIMKFMKSFYEKYLYAGTVENLKNELWKEGWELFNEVKSFLNLYQYS